MKDNFYSIGIPLNKLSTGFVSIVKIFQEIVVGYGGWSNLQDLSLVDGVVFIDEIEAHLHISWQTKLLTFLKSFSLIQLLYYNAFSFSFSWTKRWWSLWIIWTFKRRKNKNK